MSTLMLVLTLDHKELFGSCGLEIFFKILSTAAAGHARTYSTASGSPARYRGLRSSELISSSFKCQLKAHLAVPALVSWWWQLCCVLSSGAVVIVKRVWSWLQNEYLLILTYLTFLRKSITCRGDIAEQRQLTRLYRVISSQSSAQEIDLGIPWPNRSRNRTTYFWRRESKWAPAASHYESFFPACCPLCTRSALHYK